MSRRRKLSKTVSVASTTAEGPLDLRPNTILNPKERVVGIEVDNPNKPDEKVIVWRSTRDPLFMMYAKGDINEDQRLAGEHWRECYRLCEVGGLRGQDVTREYVDTSPGFHYEPVGDQQIKASKDLKRASQVLGKLDEWIMHRILGDGLFPNQVADIIGVSGERGTAYYARRFREALDTLAKTFTYCS